MMGRKEPTSKLFYQFSLEERVPQDHLLRKVAQAVDFAFVRRTTARFYSHTGQPSVDPVVLFRLALIGYLYGITSERRLAQEIRLNLAYLWFLGYDLDEPTPDHSVLSKARARFGPTVYQSFFTEVVRQCERAGLIKGDRLYVDSTLVEADASLESVSSRALGTQLPDVAAHIKKLWQDNPIPPASLEELGRQGLTALCRPGQNPEEAVAPSSTVSAAAVEMTPAVATDQSGDAESVQSDVLDESVLAVQERVEVVASAHPNPPCEQPLAAPQEEMLTSSESSCPTLTSDGNVTVAEETQVEESRPPLHLANEADAPNKISSTVNELVVSRTDPDAELVQRPGVPLDLYYKVHVGVDGGKARIITAVEATGGAVPDQDLLERVLKEHQSNVGRRLAEAVADAQYGTVASYMLLEREGILPSIPRHETGADRLPLPAKAFSYEPETDSYRCPGGKAVRRRGAVHAERVTGGVLYRANPRECALCPRKGECCPKAQARTIFRANTDPLKQRVAVYLKTSKARQSIRWRKAWVETVFGDTKVRRGLRRAQFRGVDRMRIQALLTAIAHNVRKLALRKTVRLGTGVGAKEKEREQGKSSTLFFSSLWLLFAPTRTRPIGY